jgi:hypothetical protein
MLDDFRGWFQRHLAVALAFMVGMAVGISILVLAFFSDRNDFTASMLRFGIQVTGHRDIGEDLLWLISGVVIGASIACLAWWRDNKGRAEGLEKADVVNRLFTDPEGVPPREPQMTRKATRS